MTAVARRLPFGLSRVVAPSLLGYLLINLCTFFLDLSILAVADVYVTAGDVTGGIHRQDVTAANEDVPVRPGRARCHGRSLVVPAISGVAASSVTSPAESAEPRLSLNTTQRIMQYR